jgi:hypothetical protein
VRDARAVPAAAGSSVEPVALADPPVIDLAGIEGAPGARRSRAVADRGAAPLHLPRPYRPRRIRRCLRPWRGAPSAGVHNPFLKEPCP